MLVTALFSNDAPSNNIIAATHHDHTLEIKELKQQIATLVKLQIGSIIVIGGSAVYIFYLCNKENRRREARANANHPNHRPDHHRIM